MAVTAIDPRTIITEDALHVAPQLLGLPLAGPWRRLVAISIDGILVAILANAPGALFGIAAVLVMLRAATRRPAVGGSLRRPFRVALLGGAALVVFVLVVDGWRTAEHLVVAAMEPHADSQITATLGQSDSPPSANVSASVDGVSVSGVDALRTAAGVVAFRQSKDETEARRRAEAIVTSLRSYGAQDADIRETLSGLVDGTDDKPWLRAAADSLLLRLGPTNPVGAGPTDEMEALRNERDQLSARVDQLEDEGSKTGFLGMLKGFANDLGLGFGWMGLYFTSTVALWKGRTPGKWMLGIRVVRLNGKPIGWWAAFERFGGYAAGFATGLLGFLQIFWDRNRQAIHDKISETAVIRV